MAVEDIRIPDIGDADDVEVVEILVAVGDDVTKDGPLVVIESDKASMEVPSPSGGRVARIDVKVGDRVKQGQVIAGLEVASTPGASATQPTAPPAQAPRRDAPIRDTGEPPKSAAAKAAAPPKPAVAKPAPPKPAAPPKSPPRADAPTSTTAKRLEVRLPDVGEAKDVTVVEVAVAPDSVVKADDLLVVVESDKASMEVPSPVAGRVLEVAVKPGTPVEQGSLLVVIESTQARAAATAEAPAVSAAGAPKETPEPVSVEDDGEGTASTQPAPPASPTPSSPVSAPASAANVYAGPAVRRLARELGVDLTQVNGSGARERIVKEDVQSYVKSRLTSSESERPSSPSVGIPQTPLGVPTMPVVDFSKFGAIDSVALSRIRKRGAENLHRSWLNVVHVTQHDEADVTDLEAFRAELKAEANARGVKLTPLAFIVRAVVPVLKLYPTFNASLDPTVQNLTLKRYYNIGFAVDTPDGLVVPVIRGADQKGVFDLAEEIELLSAKARDGKLTPGELSGGSFSVSSLGAIGGTGFTPIVNAPEVAILGISRLATKPHWNGASFEPRQFLPVSLSYDHRANNGAEAGRFLTAFCSTLRDLRRALL